LQQGRIRKIDADHGFSCQYPRLESISQARATLEITGIREALATSHLFSELSDEQMERVRRHSHMTDMVEGESLFYQGDNASCFYLMV
jgi:hypothetical protein